MATWLDVPADRVVDLLGADGTALHPRSIWGPEDLASRFGIPLELLPVSELVSGESVTLRHDGRQVAAARGVVAGDLIDAIAKGLGVRMPVGAPRGYSGSRWALAEAVVQRLSAAESS
jgi:hypothetical protein